MNVAKAMRSAGEKVAATIRSERPTFVFELRLVARLRVRKANVDELIRGQFQTVHPKAKGDTNSV